nr:hypothetical protein Iba_chr15bCG8820 [Ipomoea batatas]
MKKEMVLCFRFVPGAELSFVAASRFVDGVSSVRSLRRCSSFLRRYFCNNWSVLPDGAKVSQPKAGRRDGRGVPLQRHRRRQFVAGGSSVRRCFRFVDGVSSVRRCVVVIVPPKVAGEAQDRDEG